MFPHEEKIYSYMEDNGMKLGDKLDLNLLTNEESNNSDDEINLGKNKSVFEGDKEVIVIPSSESSVDDRSSSESSGHNYKLPFSCEERGRKAASARQRHLNVHIRTQVKYKPFVCQLCNKIFPTRPAWDLHMEEVHGIPLT
ncbi:hypothetical protein NQ317_005479 [Molorchus minor]|uniref:C2H2-type domain-containing protein n=1 Tax=Molorchus minor TaxID=1323400 RepID=A0ABQ9JUQ5_9CUCU|nr:hypothetical protein NQ317_005479 [Molorchus minor]